MKHATALLLIALLPTSASAHALLIDSEPAAGETLTASPRAVELDFSERLEADYSDVTVTDASGGVISGGARVSGTRLTAALTSPCRGRCRVTWHALSVDTHRTQGSFSFTVR